MNEKYKKWSDGLYFGDPGEILTKKKALELAIKRYSIGSSR